MKSQAAARLVMASSGFGQEERETHGLRHQSNTEQQEHLREQHSSRGRIGSSAVTRGRPPYMYSTSAAYIIHVRSRPGRTDVRPTRPKIATACSYRIAGRSRRVWRQARVENVMRKRKGLGMCCPLLLRKLICDQPIICLKTSFCAK